MIRQLAQAGSVGLMLVVCIFVGVGLGVLLDHWLGSRPWLTLLGLLVGIVAGFINVFRMISSLGQADKRP
jgi:ATP synthase protein I